MTLKRIRSNGLAKGPATLQSRKYPGEKRLNKTKVKCGGIRFGDVAWRPVTRDGIRTEGRNSVIGEKLLLVWVAVAP